MTKLMHHPLCAKMSNRTIKALTRAGMPTWEDLVTEACRTPNVIRGVDKLGPVGVKEILVALDAAHITHTIRSRGPRNGAAPRR